MTQESGSFAASPAQHVAISDQIRLHQLAAEQLERAAEHNRKAMQHYERGEIEQARMHAYLAEGHYIDAGPVAERLSALATTLMLLRLSRPRERAC
jgi:hypothetical protein